MKMLELVRCYKFGKGLQKSRMHLAFAHQQWIRRARHGFLGRLFEGNPVSQKL